MLEKKTGKTRAVKKVTERRNLKTGTFREEDGTPAALSVQVGEDDAGYQRGTEGPKEKKYWGASVVSRKKGVDLSSNKREARRCQSRHTENVIKKGPEKDKISEAE